MREFLAFVLGVLVLAIGALVAAPAFMKMVGNIQGNRDEIQKVGGVDETQHNSSRSKLG